MSKQKQLHVRKSYKKLKSQLSRIVNYEENINLSRIRLVVLMKVSQSQMRKFEEIQKRFHEEFGPIMNYYQSSISRSTKKLPCSHVIHVFDSFPMQ